MPRDGIADVTVVTPAYRARETVARALESIALQTIKPKRVVVVDDGSDDGTIEAIESCRPRLGSIDLTVLNQDHKGPGAARNLALKEVDTELVAFLDADDEWLPEKLALTLPSLADDSMDLVSHDMIVVDDRVERPALCSSHLKNGDDPFVALYKRGFVATSTVVARTAVLRRHDGFDESLPSGQDYELWLSVARDGKGRMSVLPRALTRYHVTANSVTSRVAERRRCALLIAARHAASLRGRTALWTGTVLTRVAIICYEAALGFWRQRRRFAALQSFATFPLALTKVLYRDMGVARKRGPERFAGSGSAPGGAIARVRNSVETETKDRQGRNRLWWERLPMTYAEWSEGDRIPRTRSDFEAVRAALLGHSPFLRVRYDFTAQKDRKVLDLGCGTGVTACLFAEAGADVTAVDLTEAAVDLARRCSEAWETPFSVARGDAERLGFVPESFDYVFSWGVLHHTSDTDQAFREVCRVLKPGGAGLVMVYHKNSAVYYLKGIYWLLAKGRIFQGHNLETVQGFYIDGYHHRHFTRRGLADALKAAGLDVDRVVVTQMQKKILPMMPRALDLWLKDRFGWLILAEFHRPADG